MSFRVIGQIPVKKPHECAPPMSKFTHVIGECNRTDYQVGDVLRCDECGRLWRLVEYTVLGDVYFWKHVNHWKTFRFHRQLRRNQLEAERKLR